MALSVIDIYRDILPQTNCGDCGFSTCMAFASMVVSEQYSLSLCPHLAPELVKRCEKELQKQYAAKKWTKRDMAADALEWAKNRSADVELSHLPERIGGALERQSGETVLKLPYFNSHVNIFRNGATASDGSSLSRWEQVFLYNHLAQGGRKRPTGNWKNLAEFPNTVSKIKSMKSHVEKPLAEAFSGRIKALRTAAEAIGGEDHTELFPSADLAVLFQPLPRVPVMLMFWDKEPDEEFEADARLLFDETVTEHLDIESILFLSERLCELLSAQEGK